MCILITFPSSHLLSVDIKGLDILRNRFKFFFLWRDQYVRMWHVSSLTTTLINSNIRKILCSFSSFILVSLQSSKSLYNPLDNDFCHQPVCFFHEDIATVKHYKHAILVLNQETILMFTPAFLYKAQHTYFYPFIFFD